MQMNERGIAIIKEYEGCLLGTYDDATKYLVARDDQVRGSLAIGYGHRGPDAYPGRTITQDQAEGLLTADVLRISGIVSEFLKRRLTPNEFSAFVCLAFDIGLKAMSGSSILHTVNSGLSDNIRPHFAPWGRKWINEQFFEDDERMRRRTAEVDLWSSR